MEILFFALLFAVFSAVVASSKGRSGFGWFLIGLFFGPFGLIVALLPSKANPAAAAPESPAVPGPGVASNSQGERACPFCAETIKAEAIVCRFCSRDLPQVVASDTGLLDAVYRGDLASVQLCLDKGANINAQNPNGATPIFLAAVQNRTELAKILIEHGADITIRNRGGKTPREAAAEQGFTDMLSLLAPGDAAEQSN